MLIGVPESGRIRELLLPYAEEALLTPSLLQQIGSYLDLLLRWNSRTNLTGVRDPEDLVQRQVGESLCALRCMPQAGSLLDFGSGAGFPGIPLQLARPALQVTLAESQGKKAIFLREAVRLLGLSAHVWPKRVEDLPGEKRFDCVAMRAVDHTPAMLSIAKDRVAPGGKLLRFLPEQQGSEPQPGWHIETELAIPQSRGRIVTLCR